MATKTKDVTDSLELIPVTDLNFDFKLTPAKIEIEGKEVLEQALTAYQKKYAGYVVTEDTIVGDTAVKNELGRVERQLSAAVKEKLDEYSNPLDEVKAWVKDILGPVKALKEDIAEQIKNFEAKETENRKQTIKEAFEAAIAEKETDLDINLFAIHFDDLAKKKCFMADNVRINQATLKIISDLVAEEATKKQQRETGLIQISEAAGKAGFGPAVYIRRYEQGAALGDVLQAILDDKELADQAKEKAELAKRIEEITSIAEAKSLAPQKYVDMLKAGKSALDVINVLHADAAEMRRAQAETERNTQSEADVLLYNQFYGASGAPDSDLNQSEGNYAQEQNKGLKTQNTASGDVGKKYGFKFTVDLIFPAENAKETKEQFKEWINAHGVQFEPKSKSVKVEM